MWCSATPTPTSRKSTGDGRWGRCTARLSWGTSPRPRPRPLVTATWRRRRATARTPLRLATWTPARWSRIRTICLWPPRRRCRTSSPAASAPVSPATAVAARRGRALGPTLRRRPWAAALAEKVASFGSCPGPTPSGCQRTRRSSPRSTTLSSPTSAQRGRVRTSRGVRPPRLRRIHLARTTTSISPLSLHNMTTSTSHSHRRNAHLR
mmetsp:Transcript_24362/g.69226  ORF Transcript_24362/g.69226 Transcript_24362/m.69226 type:complete len:208 (-) Transcript_24362:229-852(-)